MTSPPLQPASTRDQALMLIVMLLVLGLCVGLTALVSELVEDDASCDGRTFIGGKPYVCNAFTADNAIYCYPKECDQ